MVSAMASAARMPRTRSTRSCFSIRDESISKSWRRPRWRNERTIMADRCTARPCAVQASIRLPASAIPGHSASCGAWRMILSVRPLVRGSRAHIWPVWTCANPIVPPPAAACRDGGVHRQDRLAGAGGGVFREGRLRNPFCLSTEVCASCRPTRPSIASRRWLRVHGHFPWLPSVPKRRLSALAQPLENIQPRSSHVIGWGYP